MAIEEKPYHPEDAISSALNATMITGGAGLFMSAVQNSLARENIGVLGVFTRTGGNIISFGSIELLFQVFEFN
jgi:transcriptional/translational regulatory protein YebC/TACO1